MAHHLHAGAINIVTLDHENHPPPAVVEIPLAAEDIKAAVDHEVAPHRPPSAAKIASAAPPPPPPAPTARAIAPPIASANTIPTTSPPTPPTSAPAPALSVSIPQGTHRHRTTRKATAGDSIASPPLPQHRQKKARTTVADDCDGEYWPINGFLAEQGGKYLIDWEGVDPDTGLKWTDSWEPKQYVSPLAQWHWERRAILP